MDCDSIEICLVSNLTLLFIIQPLTVPKDSEKKTGQQPETDVMDQFLDPETDPERQFLNPETDVNSQFLDKKILDPETVIMDQFLDPETGEKLQFLDPETDILCQFLFWIQKLTLWISFWVQKLTLWASGTLWFRGLYCTCEILPSTGPLLWVAERYKNYLSNLKGRFDKNFPQNLRNHMCTKNCACGTKDTFLQLCLSVTSFFRGARRKEEVLQC